MKTIYALLAVLVFLVAPLAAQTVTGYTCPIKQGPVTVATLAIPVASPLLACNQPAPVVNGTDNPTKVAFDDPAFPKAPDPAARACIYSDPPTGVLAALPFSPTISYTSTCTADTSTGSSPASLPSNAFTHPGIQPPALAGIQVYR